MDLTTCDPTDGKPWDFNSEETQGKARMALRCQQPYLLIGSPMCTAFCTWQALNYAKSSVAGLYAEQAAAGRYFLHEHPSGASSWGLTAVKALQELPGATLVNTD